MDKSTLRLIRAITEIMLAELDRPPPVVVPPVLLPPPPVSPISTPAELDLALASGALTLTLAHALVYPTELTLTRPVTLQAALLPPGRMTAEGPLPTFLGGVRITGDDVALLGLQIQHTRHDTDIVVFTGARVTLDRCRILGDSQAGAKRGVAANGNGECAIRQCYIDDCFQPSPGMDSQAILAYDMAPGLTIEDNFLRAGSETIMLGGADSSAPERMPSNVKIIGNTITARPEWQALPIGVKTRVEFKACRGVTFLRNIVEHCWRQGQSGYLLTFSPRNQGGTAPWSTIEDVVVADNDFAHGPAAINILGTDNINVSQRIARITVAGNRFTDLNGTEAGQESHKLIQIIDGPVDLTIESNTFEGGFIGSHIYFEGTTKCEGLNVVNNHWPPALYGIFGSDSNFGEAWANHVGSGTLSGNVVTP
jgi:hypothetical protein